MREVGGRRRFDDGDFVFRQGEQASLVCVVLSGRLKLTNVSADGREVLIEIRGPGSLVGELGAVDGQVRSTAAIAMGTVDVLAVPSDRFRRLIAERPALSFLVLVSVARRLRQSVDRRVQSTKASVSVQLCERLLEMSEGLAADANGSIELEAALSQQEIADWLGVSRDAVVIALQGLRGEGLVETGRRRIRLVDPGRMREFVHR